MTFQLQLAPQDVHNFGTDGKGFSDTDIMLTGDLQYDISSYPISHYWNFFTDEYQESVP
jgi:hypothetical protein